MLKGFRNRMREKRDSKAAEFYAHVGNLLENEQVKQLGNFIQHRCVTRLQHSINVAYKSFVISRFFGWDAKSAARAGLLHDMYHYDRHIKGLKIKRHLRGHPMLALKNAREICDLNKIEEDIIKKHMWLITLRPPRYRESFVVSFVDKYCALKELASSLKPQAARTAGAGMNTTEAA